MSKHVVISSFFIGIRFGFFLLVWLFGYAPFFNVGAGLHRYLLVTTNFFNECETQVLLPFIQVPHATTQHRRHHRYMGFIGKFDKLGFDIFVMTFELIVKIV